MKAVNILRRINGGDDSLIIDMRWQGQLYQYAIDGGIGIECFHQRNQFDLRNRRRQAMFEAVHARFDGRFLLRSHINLAGWIFAHKHNGKAGLAIG